MIACNALVEKGYRVRSTPENMEMSAVYYEHFGTTMYNEKPTNSGYDTHLTELSLVDTAGLHNRATGSTMRKSALPGGAVVVVQTDALP